MESWLRRKTFGFLGNQLCPELICYSLEPFCVCFIWLLFITVLIDFMSRPALMKMSTCELITVCLGRLGLMINAFLWRAINIQATWSKRHKPVWIMRLRNQASLILKEHQHSYFVTRFFFPVQSYFILMY